MLKEIPNVESADRPEQITKVGKNSYDFNYDIEYDQEKGIYTYKSIRFDTYAELKVWLCEQKVDAIASLLL